MKFLKKMLKNYSSLFLIPVFVIALLLRFLYLPQNAISFAYDQARDAFVVQEMLAGNLKILGPSVSGVPGLYHGVLYYYLIAPAYYFGQGNPATVAYFLSFISSLVIFPVFLLAYLLSKNKLAALISATVFAFSFEASQYANLLTNASLAVWFVPVFYIGLYLWIKKNLYWAPILTGLGIGLSIQSEVALGYHLISLFVWLYVYRKMVTLKSMILFMTSLVFAVLPMIISEIKFGFTGLNGILYLLSNKDGISSSLEVSGYVNTLLNQSGKTFAYSIFPQNIVLGGIAGFAMIVYALKTKKFWAYFLASYIFSYSLALPFGGTNMKHVLTGVAPAVAVLTGIVLTQIFNKTKTALFVVVLIICLTNTFKIVKENKFGQTIFPLQADLVLANEINAVDYTYTSSGNSPFSISTLTSPLYVNTLWSYIYNWHGAKKYGYIPFWIGRDQVGQLGNNLAKPDGDYVYHYYITEPTYGIPDLWINYSLGDQDAISNFSEQKDYGGLKVQKRIIKK